MQHTKCTFNTYTENRLYSEVGEKFEIIFVVVEKPSEA